MVATKHEKFWVPALLYGSLGRAGHGWKKVAKTAWLHGWDKALEDLKFIDILEYPGVIVLKDRPNVTLSPEYKLQPYFAAYGVHDQMKAIANTEDDRVKAGFRLRDLVLEAMDWPWYVVTTFWPEGGFLPPYDCCFPNSSAWEDEERRVARIVIKKILHHFPLFAQVESRLTIEGMRGLGITSPELPNMRVFGILGHCLRAGMPADLVESIVKLSGEEGEQKIRDWIASK